MSGTTIPFPAASSPTAAPAVAAQDYPTPGKAWLSVGILLIFAILSVTDRQIIALLVEPIKADLKLSDTELGLLQGIAFALFYSLAGLPIGWAVDRMPRRPIIYLGITIWSLSAAACGLARSFGGLFLGRVGVGIGEATMNPIAVSMISDLFPPKRVALPFGVYGASPYLGAGISLSVGGLIVGALSAQPFVHLPLVGDVAPWQAVFIITGLPGVLIALLAFLIHDPRRHAARNTVALAGGTTVRQFARTRWRVTLHAFGGFTLATFVNLGASAWTPAFMTRTYGWQPQDIGWTLGLAMAGGGAVGALGGGALLARIYSSGRTDAYFLVSGLVALLCLPLLVGAYFMPTAPLMLITFGAGYTLFGAIAPASYSTFQKIAPKNLRGRVTAAYVLCGGLIGGGLGPLTVGVVTDHVLGDESQLGFALAIVLTVALLLMALTFLSGRRAMREILD